jgi:hypothetical protein
LFEVLESDLLLIIILGGYEGEKSRHILKHYPNISFWWD